MYNYEIKPTLQRILNKLSKKDRVSYEQVMNKISEIINSPDVEHYKNLQHDMKEKKRVHIGPAVLVFSFDKANNFISFDDFAHHDDIYKR
ncbi:MAG: addiction module toxin RelE [DPANN group archaeon]|nr:addiction module toxin RelE [DPANN group archaeon]